MLIVLKRVTWLLWIISYCASRHRRETSLVPFIPYDLLTRCVNRCTGSMMGSVVALPVSGVLCQYGFDDGWGSVFYTIGRSVLSLSAAWVSCSCQSHIDRLRSLYCFYTPPFLIATRSYKRRNLLMQYYALVLFEGLVSCYCNIAKIRASRPTVMLVQ